MKKTTKSPSDLILTDPDYIALSRYDHSMAKLLERYPDGVPDNVIAQALLLSVEDVEEIYADVVARLREIMCVSQA